MDNVNNLDLINSQSNTLDAKSLGQSKASKVTHLFIHGSAPSNTFYWCVVAEGPHFSQQNEL